MTPDSSGLPWRSCASSWPRACCSARATGRALELCHRGPGLSGKIWSRGKVGGGRQGRPVGESGSSRLKREQAREREREREREKERDSARVPARAGRRKPSPGTSPFGEARTRHGGPGLAGLAVHTRVRNGDSPGGRKHGGGGGQGASAPRTVPSADDGARPWTGVRSGGRNRTARAMPTRSTARRPSALGPPEPVSSETRQTTRLRWLFQLRPSREAKRPGQGRLAPGREARF